MALKDLPVNKPSRYLGQNDPIIIKTWISEIVGLCRLFIPDEKLRWVHYAKQNMASLAIDWYLSYNPDDIDIDWDVFEDDLKIHFLPPDYDRTIRKTFETIQCETTISDYNRRFGNIMTEVPEHYCHEEIRKDRYLEGLPPQVCMFVRPHRNLSIRELMQLAQQWESTVELSNYSKHSPLVSQLYNQLPLDKQTPYRNDRSVPRQRTWASEGYPTNFSPNRSHRRRLPDPEPMDLSTIRRGSADGPHLTPRARAELFLAGKCFYCRNNGHIARNCPKRNIKNGKGQY